MAAEAAIEIALARLRAGDADLALALLQGTTETADPARHAALGMVHLAAGRWSEALVALRMAVALGDHAPVTVLNLALAEDRAGDGTRGRVLMTELRTALPDWDEPALRLAESLRRSGATAAAEREYEMALERNPRRADALLGLAALLIGQNDAARGQMLLLRCCAIAPDRADAWDALGVSLMLTGDPSEAEAAFGQAQRLAPGDFGIAMRRGEASFAAGATTAELARLELMALENPLDIVALVARGALLSRSGQREGAIQVLEAALELAPDEPEAVIALAQALIGANQVSQAVPVLRRAVTLKPDDINLRNNLAAALVRAHRYTEAREILEALISEHGEQPSFLCNLTNALVSMGLQDDAMAIATRAVERAPEMHLAWRTMCNVLAYHPSVTGPAMLAALRQAGETIARGPAAALSRPPDPRRRLRVGLLSSTLKTHPVGWLTVAGFETLNPADFQLICIGQADSDDLIQRRFRAAAAEWHVADGIEPLALANQIRGLGIDILIDLGGYGDRGLLPVCAERVAPVQIKWVGTQSHSTGLAEMDWFITDRWETPEGYESFYSERLLRLPNGYVCYSPPAYAPDVERLPALRRGAVTFGCFNNLAKITPAVIETWSAILRRVKDSRLVMKAHQLADAPTCARLHAEFAAHGIAATRIELRAGSPHRALLAEYNDIDIVLDPFPYSGGLTTCEALWMGVPTITVPGETFASRHSVSHLSNVGLADWVAADLAAYQNMAVQRAGDLEALARLRLELRGRVKASPLCDGPRFGTDLGMALRHAWTTWCSEQREA